MKEQSIDDRITIKTKSLQQIESLKHQINVKQSESQKQSDLMKQLEEKHTAATRVKEEEIVSMRNAHANEKAKLNDEKMVELAQKDRVIQDMKHEQQTKEEKRNKAMEAKEEEMKRVRGIVNDMNQLCTETISKFRNENESKIQITTTKIAQMKHNVNTVMGEIVRQTEQIKSLKVVNEEAKWRDATNALQTSFSQKDNEVKHLTSTQNVDSIYQDINSKNLKRMRKENEEYKERIKEMDEEAKEMEQSIDDLTTIKTKSLQQSDLMKQLEDKHTEATRVKQEDMKRLESQLEAVMIGHKQQLDDSQRLEKIIKEMEADSAQMQRKLTENQNEIATLKQEKTKEIKLKESESQKHKQVLDKMLEMEHKQQQKESEHTVLRSLYNAKLEELTTKDQQLQQEQEEIERLTDQMNHVGTQQVDNIYQDINGKNLKRIRSENEEMQRKLTDLQNESNAKMQELRREIVRLKEEKTKESESQRIERDKQLKAKENEYNEKIVLMNAHAEELAQKDRRIQLNDRVKVIQQNNPDRGHMIGFVCRLLIILVMIIAITPILLQSRTFYCYMDQLFDRFGVVANYKTVSECLSK
eukprot:988688_1